MHPATVGPYKVIRLLGEGGMGAVYEGVHDATARRVALKILLPEFARDITMTARFFNEARSVNKIEHPGILQIFDYGQQENGCAYIAMELLKGETLGSRLERGPKVRPLGEVLRLTWQIASALAAAHENGIVHRDLKPDNIMIVPDPDAPGRERTKLLDFGIAKLVESVRGQQPKTQSQLVMGTPQYMSPEQCKGASHVDDKTDVYALGVLFFEMLAGRLPFVAESGGEYIGMHLFRMPPRLNEIAPSVPSDLAGFADGLLVKDKTVRPSMAQVVTTLGQFVRRYGSPGYSSEQLRAVASPSNGPTVLLAPNSALRRSMAQLNQTLTTPHRLAIGVGIIALAIGGFLVLRGQHPKVTATDTSLAAGSNAKEPSGTPADAAKTLPTAAPRSKKIRWVIQSTPSGAAIVDADGKVLGQTPWEQQAPAATGTRTLLLKLSGYNEQTVTLDRSSNASRQERLRPVAPKSNKSTAVKPSSEKKKPEDIEYEP